MMLCEVDALSAFTVPAHVNTAYGPGGKAEFTSSYSKRCYWASRAIPYATYARRFLRTATVPVRAGPTKHLSQKNDAYGSPGIFCVKTLSPLPVRLPQHPQGLQQ